MITRFAPSPTGYLHLGHVAAMMHVWGLAAREQAVLHVRIEDHDRQRCRPEFTLALREDLAWLGFTPLFGGDWSQQSEQNARYQQALERLRDGGHIYVCRCSRKTLVQEFPDGEGRYPGNCRDLNLADGPDTCLRVRLPEEAVRFHDARHGWQTQHPARQCGDIVVRDRHGQWTYQFAVVVDDLLDGIDWVVRGDDLLQSTGRQLLLAQLLGRQQPLSVFHHSLILGRDGQKLSKRDEAAPVRDLRAQGVSPEAVLGLAAFRCGLASAPTNLAVADLPRFFEQHSREALFGNPFQFTARP